MAKAHIDLNEMLTGDHIACAEEGIGSGLPLQRARAGRDAGELPLESIVEHAAAGILALNAAGEIVHCNPVAAQLAGVTAAEARGRRYDWFLHQAGLRRPISLEAMRERKREKQPAVVCCVDQVKNFEVRRKAVVIRNGAAAPRGVVETLEFCSEKAEKNAALAQLRSFARLGKLVGLVVHKIRNPLGGISGFASLLQKELALDDQNREYAIRILDCVNRVNGFLTDLVALTREMQAQFSKVELNAITRKILDYLARQPQNAGNRPPVQFDAAREEISVQLDLPSYQEILRLIYRLASEDASENAGVRLRLFRAPDVPEACLEATLEGLLHQSRGEGASRERPSLFAHSLAELKLAMIEKYVELNHARLNVQIHSETEAIIRIIFRISK